MTFSPQAACEPHTPVGLVLPFVFTLSLQIFRLTAHGRVLNLDNRLFTVPYVFFKDCQDRALTGTDGPSRFYMYPGGTYETKIVKMAARSLKRSILTILRVKATCISYISSQ